MLSKTNRRVAAILPLAFVLPFETASSDSVLEVITIEGSESTAVSPSIPQGLRFEGSELLGAPGSGGDVLRAIDSLPGMAVGEDTDGGVAIRGSRPENNQYIVDFLPSGYLFHFTGNSVIDGDLVERFDIYPAGYGAEFQGNTGGVLLVDTRDPKDDFSGALDLSLIDAGVLVEGSPRDGHKGFFSARLSYYDLLLEGFIEEDDDDAFKIVQLPKYFDYRGKYLIDSGPGRQFQLMIDGATDDAEFFLTDGADEVIQDPVLAGRYAFDVNYHRQALLFESSRSGELPFKMGLGNRISGTQVQEGNAGQLDISIQTTTLKAEVEPRSPIPLKLGTSIERVFADYDVAFRDPGCTEFETDCRLTDAEVLQADRDLTVLQWQSFAEAIVPVSDKSLFTLGLGVNAEDYLDETHLEPRLRYEYTMDSQIILSGAYGRYHEFPDFAQVEESFGNPNLEFFQADHWVLGAEREQGAGWFWKVEAYYKALDNLVTGNDTSRYSNSGEGEARGLELFVKKQMTDRWSGWLSLSWSEAERKNTQTGETFDFEFDQPLIASLVLKHKLSDKVTLSSKARYHTGQPYTPVVGAELDQNNPGSVRAIYGEINSERLPSYFRLDLRMDYQSRPDSTQFYAEIVNATNRTNISGYDYNADYSERENVEQLPLFIYFGIRHEW